MKSKAIVSAITVAALSFGSLSFAQGSYDRRAPATTSRSAFTTSALRSSGSTTTTTIAATTATEREDSTTAHAAFMTTIAMRVMTATTTRAGRSSIEVATSQGVPPQPVRGQRLARATTACAGARAAVGAGGADYALIAIATGVIAQLVLNSR